MRILDSQAPDIQVIANRPDDIHHKAPIHAHSETQAQEHKRNLVYTIAQRAWPAHIAQPAQIEPINVGVRQMFAKPWPEAVNGGKEQGEDEDVGAGEGGFAEVSGDHAADAECVDESNVEDEGHKVLVQDDGLQVEVERDESPGGEEGKETEHGTTAALAARAAGLDDVLGAGEGC